MPRRFPVINRLPLSALALSLAFCGRDDGPSSMLEAAAPSQTLAQYALDQLPDLRNGVPLGAWRQSHATERVTLYAPTLAEPEHENWCARAAIEITLDSHRTATRTAYFYPPATPNVLTLPSETLPETLVDQCRLGFVWIEVAEADSERATILSDETKQSMSTALGAGDTVTTPLWSGSGSWRNSALWTKGELAVVAAITNEPVRREDAAAARPSLVFVAGVGEHSGISFEGGAGRAERFDRVLADHASSATSRIEETIALAGLGGDVERSMRSVLRIFQEDPASATSPADREQLAFADAIDQWLLRSKHFPAARRAAALVAADQLLQGLVQTSTELGDPNQPTLRKRFAAHGAEFEHAALGGWFVYTHTWLKEALNIAPDSRAGEIAFLTLMEMGFETSPSCQDQKGHDFRAVIARGEHYLGDKPGSAISTDVHFMVAKAYSDIVTLANGGGYENMESAAYIAEAPTARARAVEKYKVAFARAPASTKARDSWPNAWRLMAHLTPTRTFFNCVWG